MTGRTCHARRRRRLSIPNNLFVPDVLKREELRTLLPNPRWQSTRDQLLNTIL